MWLLYWSLYPLKKKKKQTFGIATIRRRHSCRPITAQQRAVLDDNTHSLYTLLVTLFDALDDRWLIVCPLYTLPAYTVVVCICSLHIRRGRRRTEIPCRCRLGAHHSSLPYLFKFVSASSRKFRYWTEPTNPNKKERIFPKKKINKSTEEEIWEILWGCVTDY